MYAQIAQLVEQRTENPRVTGSIPVLGIIFFLKIRLLAIKSYRRILLYYREGKRTLLLLFRDSIYTIIERCIDYDKQNL